MAVSALCCIRHDMPTALLELQRSITQGFSFT